MRWFGKVLRGALLALLGILFGVALIEAVGRMAPGIMPSGLRLLNRAYDAEVNWSRNMAPDAFLGYHMRPSMQYEEELEGQVIRSRLLPLDSRDIGVRDMGAPLSPVDGIAVGDSFTFCSSVPAEQCWLKVVADQTGRSFVNLGVPGYSALQETRMLERYGVGLRPRLILWGIFLNDFKEDVRFQRWTTRGQGDFLDWVRRQRLSAWTDFLERYSLVYRVARRTFIAGERDVHRWHGQNADIRFSGAGWWRDIVDIREQDPAWQLMRTTILDQKRLADGIGARLVVLLFPFKEQAYWHVVKTFAKNREQCDPDRPYRMIADLCRDQGIAADDLTSTFRTHAEQGEVLYLRDDAHWNTAGNLLAGRAVAAFLREQQQAAK